MISNQRQLGIAEQKLRSLEAAAASAQSDVDRAALDSLMSDVRSEVQEFIQIRDGLRSEFRVDSIDELGDAIIKARIAVGFNQRQLAEEMGVSPQAVQKDEASRYERASLARIAEIADALEHELVGTLRPVGSHGGVTDHAAVTFNVAFQGRVRPAPTDATQQNSYNRGLVKYWSNISPVGLSQYGAPSSSGAGSQGLKVENR